MTNDLFLSIFLLDLAPNQDDATDGAGIVAGSVEVVEWHAANDADCNVIEAGKAGAFIAWLTGNAAALAAHCDDIYWPADDA